MVPTCAPGLGHMLGSEPAPPRSLTLCPCARDYVKPGDKPRHFFIKKLHIENLFLVKAATWWTSGYMTQSEVKVKSLSRVRLFATPWTVGSRLLSPWNFPGKRTGMGRHFLLQGIFPTQGSNLGLLYYRQTLYRLSHQGSPTGHKPVTKRQLLCGSTHSFLPERNELTETESRRVFVRGQREGEMKDCI